MKVRMTGSEVSVGPSPTVGAFEEAPPEPTEGAPPEASDAVSELVGAPADMEGVALHATERSAPASE